MAKAITAIGRTFPGFMSVDLLSKTERVEEGFEVILEFLANDSVDGIPDRIIVRPVMDVDIIEVTVRTWTDISLGLTVETDASGPVERFNFLDWGDHVALIGR